jgi:hypothetical protein
LTNLKLYINRKNKGRSNGITRLGLTAYPSESTKLYTEN